MSHAIAEDGMNTAAICPDCKRLVFVCVNEIVREYARDIAGFVRKGFLIQQMDTESVRNTEFRCTCVKETPARKAKS